MITWRGKQLIPDHKRNADKEMIELGLDTSDIIEILEKGKEVRKRKKHIIEKWYRRGKAIYIAAVEDMEDYWLIRHVGISKVSRKKLRMLGDEKI